ncbi:hypothetical protein GCM10029978_107390 [Actinoallomurus acanthiterrae]
MAGWKRWSWALAGAFALHNTEEALTMRRLPSLAGRFDQAGRSTRAPSTGSWR